MVPDSGENDHLIAFLIIEGTKVFVISKPLLNIGRKPDNDIVIENESVSRNHVLISKIEGDYYIKDLDSTVGTSVNGISIQGKKLTPGDVISLGGVPFIFGVGFPKHNLENRHDLISKDGDSQPTNGSPSQSTDEYLDFFKTSEE